jgi:hypothetical protein
MLSSLSKVEGPPLRKTEDWVKFDSTYNTEKKPLDTVLVRLAMLMALFAVATAVITPPLLFLLPAWKAVVVMMGIVLIYFGLSFIIRPQVDRDNLDWRPGSLTSEPAANLNRLLAIGHWLLTPGRFAAETLMDVCVLLGVGRANAPVSNEPASAAPVGSPQPSPYSRASH